MTDNSFSCTRSRFLGMQMEGGKKDEDQTNYAEQLMILRFYSSRTLSLAAASMHIIINGIILALVSFPILASIPIVADINIAIAGEPAPFQEFLFNFSSASFYNILTSSFVTVFLWYFSRFIWGVALLYGVIKEESGTLSIVIGVKLIMIVVSLMTFFVSVITAPKLLLSVPLILLVTSVYFMPLPFNILLFPLYLWTFGSETFLWLLGSALLDYWIICILNDFQLHLKHSN